MIKELEEYLRFPVKRVIVKLDYETPHDEAFSYAICQRFFNKPDQLKTAMQLGNKALNQLLKKEDYIQISHLFALVGNMYYLQEKYKISAGYFLKSINYNKKDLTSWIELIFSIRAMGDFDTFDKCIFNLKKLYTLGQREEEITQQTLLKLIEQACKNG